MPLIINKHLISFFVLAISNRWESPEIAYRAWHRSRTTNDFGLGAVQYIQAQSDVYIANMIGQHGIKTGSHGPPVRYDAIEKCLIKLAEQARILSASVHMPRIGCGLAGGKWAQIEPLIITHLISQKIPVYIYDFD